MPTIPDVKVLPPVSPEDGGTPTEPTVPVTPPVVPPVEPGSKTESALLLKSLQEEREKRRDAENAKTEAEAKLKELQDTLASGDTLSAEGKVLKEQIATLEGSIASMTADTIRRDLEVKFPALKDKASEFAEFRKNYPPGNDESIAKIFLAENGLLETAPPRIGLEKPSGGGRNPTPQGWTYASIEDLRKNNFRRYSQLLKEGAFKDVAS